MDLDKQLVAAIAAEGVDAMRAVRSRGVTTELLTGEGREAFKFLVEYIENHNSMPDPSLIEGASGCELEPPTGKALFFAEEVFNRELHVKLMEGLKEPMALIDKREPRKAVESLQKLLYDLRSSDLITSQILSMFEQKDAVVSLYKRMKAGERGLPFPWKRINDDTLGMWPEELVVFVARTNVGKSWMALLCAREVWMSGKKVLFLTTEMSQLAIANRFAGVHTSLPYSQFRKGDLAPDKEAEFFAGMELWDAYKSGTYEANYRAPGDDQIVQTMLKDLSVVGGDFDYQIDSLAAAVDEAKPDVVVIDGAYLIKVPGKDRTERAAEVFNELKRLMRRCRIPFVVTMQFNREVKKNKADTVNIESMALTDVGAWNASMVFAMVQTEEMKDAKQMIIKQLKARESGGIKDMRVRWDLDTMNFEELENDGGGGGDADEQGSAKSDANPNNPVPPEHPF